MKVFLAAAVSFGFLASFAWARGGDSIRFRAPVTALIYDLQDGNLGPLEDAVFNKEIDFFLDYQGVQNTAARELYYLREAGRAAARGDALSARNYLRSFSKYPNEKLFIESVLQASSGSYEEAMRGFLSLIEKRKELSNELRSKAFLGAARVAHEVGDYKKAIFYFSRLNQLDPLFFESVFEKSWSFYMQGDMNGALGASLTFASPYSDREFYPEVWIVRAASFYQLCLFDRAKNTIDEMKKKFVPLQAQVNELKRRGVEKWLFDERVLTSVDPKILHYMIKDRDFRSLQRAEQALAEEVDKLGGAERVRAQQALEFVRTRMMRRANELLQKISIDLDKNLAEADTIQIEILQLGVNVITGAPVEIRDDIRIISLGDVDFNPQIQFWPFHGEFWFDELGSYYYGLRSQCDQNLK